MKGNNTKESIRKHKNRNKNKRKQIKAKYSKLKQCEAKG